MHPGLDGLLSDTILLAVIGATAVAFLLACSLALLALHLRMQNSLKARRWGRLESKWESTLADVVQGSASVASLQQSVAPSERLYFVDFLFRHARLMNGESLWRVLELAAPYLAPLAERIGRGDPEQRARAIFTLGILAPDHYTDKIEAALDDPSPLVALAATKALAQACRSESIGRLLRQLTRFRLWNPTFVSSLIAAMGIEAAPTLREALCDRSHDPRARAVIADALRILHDPMAADVAQACLVPYEHTETIAACVRLIGELGGPQHAPAIATLCDHPDFVVRIHATKALAKLDPAQALPRLREALDDAVSWVAIQAAWGLKQVGDSATLESLAASAKPRAPLARQVLAEINR